MRLLKSGSAFLTLENTWIHNFLNTSASLFDIVSRWLILKEWAILSIGDFKIQ